MELHSQGGMVHLNHLRFVLFCILLFALCDLGKPPHIAQSNFAEINKLTLKLLCLSLFLINFDNT